MTGRYTCGCSCGRCSGDIWRPEVQKESANAKQVTTTSLPKVACKGHQPQSLAAPVCRSSGKRRRSQRRRQRRRSRSPQPEMVCVAFCVACGADSSAAQEDRRPERRTCSHLFSGILGMRSDAFCIGQRTQRWRQEAAMSGRTRLAHLAAPTFFSIFHSEIVPTAAPKPASAV